MNQDDNNSVREPYEKPEVVEYPQLTDTTAILTI